jgi:hypothetical protein
MSMTMQTTVGVPEAAVHLGGAIQESNGCESSHLHHKITPESIRIQTAKERASSLE